MTFSRRHFIKLSGATSAGILGLGSFAFGKKKSFFVDDLPSEIYGDPLFGYTAADFRKYLGTEFSLLTESVPITGVLVAVKSSATSRNGTAQGRNAECFTLSFRLPSDATQATYTVFHPRLGTFNLFSVPGRSSSAKSLLHAVVNRV